MGKMMIPLLLIVWLPACSKTSVNNADATAPIVEIRARMPNGQYQAVSQLTFHSSYGEPLDLMCVTSDPEGLRLGSLSFSGKSDSCTVSSEVSSGVYYIQNLPEDVDYSYSPDSSGNVPKQGLPLLATMKTPSCTAAGKQGYPMAATVQVQCSAQNWSGDSIKNSTKKVLEIKLE